MQIEVRKPTDKETKIAEAWPTWSKEISQFDWSYDDQETCLILEGAATVKTDHGQQVNFQAGDWVVFPKGVQCTWQVTQDLKKKYQFS